MIVPGSIQSFFTRRSQKKSSPHLWQSFSVHAYAYLHIIVKDTKFEENERINYVVNDMKAKNCSHIYFSILTDAEQT
jgi:hypothetical protein